MKKAFKYQILFPLMIIFLSLISVGLAEDTVNVSVDVKYRYDLARQVGTLVNEFRAEDGVWYWNKDNETKTYPKLSPLTYDYGLEETAMKRAAECAIYYSHTRPNGTKCFTLFPDLTCHASENIAAGQFSATAVMTAWKEENDLYSGQGHRRNMLDGNVVAIGCGCVEANGLYFWTQAFLAKTTGQPATVLSSPYSTTASLALLIQGGLETDSGLTNLRTAVSSLSIPEGGVVEAPSLTADTESGYFAVPITLQNPQWQATGTQVTIDAAGIKGAAGGKTTIFWEAGTERIEIPVRVICTSHTWDDFVVDTAATCCATGLKHRVCSVCDENEEVIIPVDPQAHQWSDVVYSWAEDHLKVTASRSCALSSTHDESETVSASAAVTRAATCTCLGQTTYTGTAFQNPSFTVQVLALEDIPATGHSWGVPVFVWENTASCSVTFTCETCLEKQPVPATITSEVTTPAGDLTPGLMTYTASVFFNEETWTEEKSEEIPALFTVQDGVLIGYTGTDLNIVIPESVTEIAPGALAGTSVRQATIGAQVTAIGANAFPSGTVIVAPAFSFAANWAEENRYPSDRINISLAKLASVKDQVFTGKALQPDLTLTYKNTDLVLGTDYRVEFFNNQNIGQASLTIHGIGKYTGSKSGAFSIVPKVVKSLSLKAGKRQLTVSWKKDKAVDGYEIQYSLKKDFKGAKKISIRKAGSAKTALKKLQAGKKYYVRIRSFKKVNGKTYYSEWSKSKNKKTK